MKFKLFNLLAISVATLGGLTASQSAFGHSVERQRNLEQVQHLVCVKERQHLLCNIDKSRERNSKPAHAVAVKEGKAALDLNSSSVNVVPQLLNPEQQKSIANIVLGFGYLVPFSTCLGIFLYDKYCDYRATILNKQIEMLETLWKQDF